MTYIEVKVTFDHADPQLAGDLTAGLFFDFDLQGVVVEDPGLEPAEDWAEDALARPAQHAVIGYLPKDERLERCCRRLEDDLRQLARKIGLTYRIGYRAIDEEDWAESWKAFFWPKKIGARIVVKPSWRPYADKAGELVIELDPGMAFGTGTHPTTALCLELIETHLKPGGAFLDIGTGSGILMAAAGMLGAGRLCGGDRDAQAVRIAAENLRRNGLTAERACLVQGQLAQPFGGGFDLITANILTHVILELIEDIPRVLNPGGVFICSGIIAENKNLVAAEMHALDFQILEVRLAEGWAAMAAQIIKAN
jgi:ribosomal protein L11 methyltransferase